MSGKGGVDGGEGVACGPGDGVPDRPDLQPDEVIELVATVAGRGQSEPAPGRDLGDRERERSCGHVVALVDDDKAVVLGPRGHVVVSSEGLEGCDVEHAGGLGPAAAALSDLDPEQLTQTRSSLVGQCLAEPPAPRGRDRGRPCALPAAPESRWPSSGTPVDFRHCAGPL